MFSQADIVGDAGCEDACDARVTQWRAWDHHFDARAAPQDSLGCAVRPHAPLVEVDFNGRVAECLHRHRSGLHCLSP